MASRYATYHWKITRNISTIWSSFEVFRRITFKYPLCKILLEYPILLKQINSNNTDPHLISNKHRHYISIQEKGNTFHFVKIRN